MNSQSPLYQLLREDPMFTQICPPDWDWPWEKAFTHPRETFMAWGEAVGIKGDGWIGLLLYLSMLKPPVAWGRKLHWSVPDDQPVKIPSNHSSKYTEISKEKTP